MWYLGTSGQARELNLTESVFGINMKLTRKNNFISIYFNQLATFLIFKTKITSIGVIS